MNTDVPRRHKAVRNVAKDFRVCWPLDVLFNGPVDSPARLPFNGRTCLAQSFGVIVAGLR